MPFKRVLINSIHYWILFAFLNAAELYMFPSGQTYSPKMYGFLCAIWLYFEYMNYKCHKILGGFRKEQKKKDDKEY